MWMHRFVTAIAVLVACTGWASAQPLAGTTFPGEPRCELSDIPVNRAAASICGPCGAAAGPTQTDPEWAVGDVTVAEGRFAARQDRGARPSRADSKLVKGLRAMPAACANDDSDAADDGRGDDYDTSAGCSLGVVMPPTAACEARNVDYGGPAEHTAAKVFERCYGGQGNRAGPHHTT